MSVGTAVERPTLAVWKFASCDGCQLSVLDLEPELLALTRAVKIAHFTEMTRAHVEGPYDVSLVEGSITTTDDLARIREVRDQSRYLVTIGACATAGGVQALRNFVEPGAYASMVYAHPEYLQSLDTSTPVSDHVAVDYELRGCPIDRFSSSKSSSPCWRTVVRLSLPIRCARSARPVARSVLPCPKRSPVSGR